MPVRFGSLLALPLLLFPAAEAQQQTDTQQAPAPIVRVRPRPQNSVPVTAPPDAAPLVNRAPRPRPINPQDLGGTGMAPGQSAPVRPRTTQTTPATGSGAPVRPGTATATGETTVPRTQHGVTAGQANGSASQPVRQPSQQPGGQATTQSTKPATSPAAAGAGAPAKLSANGLNRTVVVLDAGHGGSDSGSRIGENTLEKNVTLALALRLRSLLIARGFTVVLTRDNDTGLAAGSANAQLTLDDRAGIANHARAAACLFLHATGRGNGLHLYTSELEPAPGETPQLSWLTAQAAWIPASEQLERSVSSALGRSHIALVSSTASIRPLDSLTCPALVVELAPESGDAQSVNDAGYQDRVAAAVAGALVFWQNQVQPPPKLTLAAPTTHSVRHRAPAATSSVPGVREP